MEFNKWVTDQVSRSGERISPRVQAGANRYLAEKGITLEQLNSAQQQCVFRYIESKRVIEMWLAGMVIAGCGGAGS